MEVGRAFEEYRQKHMTRQEDEAFDRIVQAIHELQYGYFNQNIPEEAIDTTPPTERLYV